jgi:hypothetical protein
MLPENDIIKMPEFFISKIQELRTGLLKKNEKKLVRSFNFTFHYIDNVILLSIKEIMIGTISSGLSNQLRDAGTAGMLLHIN